MAAPRARLAHRRRRRRCASSSTTTGRVFPPVESRSVFRPFRRLEASRNRDTGGTGLGLTIARTVARAHGGDVILANRPEGGLRAEIVLPLAGGSTVGRNVAT